MVSVLVLMTTGSKREARKIAEKLLDRHLIACANIHGPFESHFWWKKKVERTEEFLVLMKSDQRLFAQLAETVKQMHSYDVPEILALPIVEGYQPYLDWLNASLTESGESK